MSSARLDTPPRRAARAARAALLYLVLLLPSRPVQAATVEASVTAGAGYDSNALLEVRPASVETRAAGAFAAVEPSGSVTLKWGHWRPFAGYDGSFRHGEFGLLSWNTLQSGVAYYGTTTRVSLALGASHFAASRFTEENFFGLGPQADVSLALAERWRALAAVLTQWRSSNMQTQRLDGAIFNLRYGASSSWNIDARTTWLSVADTASGADLVLKRLRIGPAAQLLSAKWNASTAPFLGWRELRGASALQYGAVAAIAYSLPHNFGLRAEFDATLENGSIEAGRADRHEVLLAITWADASNGRALASPPGASAERHALAPLVESGRVRFRIRAPKASEVRVVGSFDSWGRGKPLSRRAEEDVWEVWVPATPGALRYHFMVDGVATKPPESARYVADGFGGFDGEVHVPSRSR